MPRAAEARVIAEQPRDEVVVELGDRTYPVVIGAGILGELGPRMAALGLGGRVGLVTSARVGALYREPAVASLRGAGLEPVLVEIPDGEEHKNAASLALVHDRLIEVGVERRSAVVGLGGGVVTDLAGFAAATLLRGVSSVLVPTTLLAQVDAAIGGKTGINHPRGKNLIGAFHQPRLVLADVATLATLPRRELVAGIAEVIKYGVILDPALFQRLEGELAALLEGDPALLVPIVTACCRLKAAVVADDEREERGGRAVLNFGHTVGHAIETLTGYRQLLHGEAVAIGMVAAARVSRALGRCDGATVARIERLLERAGLPTEMPAALDAGALIRTMQGDKKSKAGRIRFVCVTEIGRTEFVELTGREIVNHL
jgi:3-dehydroquinate synthase